MRIRTFLATVAMALAAFTALGAPLPDWLKKAAATPERKLPKATEAQLLLDEGIVEIAPNGSLTRTDRQAIRILASDGKGWAVAKTFYDKEADKIVSFRAWMISPSGAVTEYKKKDIVYAAYYSSYLELYGDTWRAMIDGREGVSPGCIFAFEAVKQERSVFSQERFIFQSPIPVEKSTFSIKVPAGWTVSGRLFNTEAFEPKTIDGRLAWSMEQLPAMPDEAFSPSEGATAPWLAIDYHRPDGAKGSDRSWAWSSWREVSEHFTKLHDDAAAPDASVQARSSAIAGGTTSRLEEIRALTSYAQGLNYISISMNSASGGGMIPRPATRVLACGYGDCKDKSALLRSLLTARGIESYAVVLYSGDSEHVQESWPSPNQFNHCIVAIRVDDSVTGPAVGTSGTLGRLLFFDPTVSNAPAGILPWSDQGGLALVLAGTKGELLRLPSASAEDNVIERRVKVRIGRLGGIAGTIDEKFIGNMSVPGRNEVRDNTPTQYREIIEKWLGYTMPAARAVAAEPVDDFPGATLSLHIQFEAPLHGRMMRDKLLVFKPVLVSRRWSGMLASGVRKTPVVFEASTVKEVSEFELPEGFKIEEMIPPVEIEASFGSYKAKGHLDENGRFIFERACIFKPSVIPPSEYKIVRDFFEKIVEAENSPVVLSKL